MCAKEYVDSQLPKEQFVFIDSSSSNPNYAIKYGHLVIVTFSVEAHTTHTWGGVMTQMTVPWKAKFNANAAADGQNKVVLSAHIFANTNVVQILELISASYQDFWARGQLIYFTDD